MRFLGNLSFSALMIGICGLIPDSHGALMMPLWVSLPLLLGGGGLWFWLPVHGLKK